MRRTCKEGSFGVDAIRQLSTDRLVVSDLVRAAAQISLNLKPANSLIQNLQNPVMSGRLLAYQVRPGLTASAHDVTYLSDQDFTVDMEPSLMCAVLLQGHGDVMRVSGHGEVSRSLGRPVIVGSSERTTWEWPMRKMQRCCGSGFTLTPAFFDRFGEHVAHDGLATLRKFCSAPFSTQSLTQSPQLLDLARRALDHPYEGPLGELFLECNTLAFVVEVAKLLDDESRLVRQIGRTHYDRVIEAREMLDANLVEPPRTLDLARHVGTNITTLQADFKAIVGMTIFRYVSEQRLLMARVLLVEHGVSVAEAGYRVGFSSPAAFTAAYRRSFGHSPGKETSGRGEHFNSSN
jgi:AraC-like DNA-binding protein